LSRLKKTAFGVVFGRRPGGFFVVIRLIPAAMTRREQNCPEEKFWAWVTTWGNYDVASNLDEEPKAVLTRLRYWPTHFL